MKNQLLAATILMLTASLANAASSSETALAAIDNALHSKNPDTRKEAVRALAIVGLKQPYQDRLEAMLNDKDAQVRLAAVANLAEAQNAPSLRLALDDRTPEVRFAAAKALFNMNDPAGRAALIRMLKGDAKTASNFIAAQERAGLRTLQTPTPMMIMAVRYSGAFAPVPGAGIGMSMALKAMSKSGASDRAAIALLLTEKKDAEIVAALEHALTDKDAPVRAAAIQAITLGDDPALAHDTEPMLHDKNLSVRLRAAACYLRLNSSGSSTVVRSWEE